MPMIKTKNNVKKKRNNVIFAHFIPDDQHLVAIFLWKEQSAAKAFHSTVLHLILSWEHLGILMCNRCRIKCKIFISPSFYLLTAQQEQDMCIRVSLFVEYIYHICTSSHCDRLIGSRFSSRRYRHVTLASTRPQNCSFSN